MLTVGASGIASHSTVVFSGIPDKIGSSSSSIVKVALTTASLSHTSVIV